MAKQKNKQKQAPVQEAQLPLQTSSLFSFSDFKTQAIVIAIIGFVFYFNSFQNEFALDDGIVINKNEYVQQGIKGIPKILSKDAYDSFYRQMNAKDQLSGGRYRPLSIVTFAIEQEFIGTNPKGKVAENCWDKNGNGKMDPEEDVNGDGLWNENDCFISGMHVRHVINVLLYILSCVVLLYFLRFVVFPNSYDIAFIAALLFTIHPLHTEVVANVKSRDEIMSVLFICLTFIYAFKYIDDNKRVTLLKAQLCFFLALLSKEYAVTLVALIPILTYIHTGQNIKNFFYSLIPVTVSIILCGGIYFLAKKSPNVENILRQSVNFLIIVFLLISLLIKSKKFQADNTIMLSLGLTYILLAYVRIRLGIVILKADVPDNEVLNNPYLFATKPQQLATEISTTFNYFKLLIFPHPLSADYSYNAIPYKDFTNPEVLLSIFAHIGMVVAGVILFVKRNILSFAIAFYLFNLILICNIFLNIGATMGERLIYHSSVGFAIALAYLFVKGIEKLKSAESSKRSIVMALLAVVVIASGFKTIERNADWKNDITLFTKDVNVVPGSALANGNAGARYIDLSERPENKAQEKELLNKAIGYLDKAISIHERYVTSYINRGLAYYKLGDLEKTKENWDMVEKYYPHYPDIPRYKEILAQGYLNRALNFGKEQKYTEAIAEMEKAKAITPNNPEVWYNLGGAYFTIKDYQKALDCWQKTLELKPDHPQAKQGYEALKAMVAQSSMKK